MKPRLKPARMTIEDEAVWIRALHRAGMPSYVWHWYEQADRRDADLMLDAQLHPLAWLCSSGPGSAKVARYPGHELSDAEHEAFG